MKNNINQTTLHPYSRSVSIIGVGCTPFMYTMDNPETEGLTEGELFGYAAYKAMEDAYRAGKFRAIGVANFLEKNYKSLLETTDIVPAVDQIETHVFRQQKNMRELLKKNGTIHESWSPLACGQNGFFRNPTVKEIGIRYGKTNAQVGLRFLYQQDIVIIPKSTHIERMKENLNILDFELTPEEMKELAGLDLDRSMFGWW